MNISQPAYSIVVIEDEVSYRSNMEMILAMEGFSVRSAPDGRAGLELMCEELPDLILCDIMMPGMDGHAFFDILKSDPMFAEVSFIFVTALADRADLRKAMVAGADDYLTKPFTAEELIAAVTSRLSRMNLVRQRAGNQSFQKEIAFMREQVTRREYEVLLLVGKGATSKQIADQLCISVKTVDVHRKNLMNKLDAGNAAALARWAVIAELA